MSKLKRRDAVSVFASVALAMLAALLGTPAAAGEHGAAPAPENLQVLVNEQGMVDRLEWEAPSGVSEPARYDVNYRFAHDGPRGEQVFWSTEDTFLEASGTFGRFVECTPQHRPDEEWVVWITYRTPTGESERSNQISMCFP